MKNKFIGIIIVIIGVLVILAIGYLIFFYDFGSDIKIEPLSITKVNSETAETSSGNISNSDNSDSVSAIVSSRKDISQGELKKIAASFVERFGSYSNHSDFSNIDDLKSVMSIGMKDWADGYLEEMRAKKYSDEYFGVTTKSVLEEVNKYDDNRGLAEILVKTQKRESNGTMNNAKTYSQDILIKFVKEDDVWKVDEAEWEE